MKKIDGMATQLVFNRWDVNVKFKIYGVKIKKIFRASNGRWNCIDAMGLEWYSTNRGEKWHLNSCSNFDFVRGCIR